MLLLTKEEQALPHEQENLCIISAEETKESFCHLATSQGAAGGLVALSSGHLCASAQPSPAS
jgi:hypothetical protein